MERGDQFGKEALALLLRQRPVSAGADDDIERPRAGPGGAGNLVLEAAERLAQEPLEPVPHHRVPDGAPDRQPEARVGQAVGQGVRGQWAADGLDAGGVHRLVLERVRQAVTPAEGKRTGEHRGG